MKKTHGIKKKWHSKKASTLEILQRVQIEQLHIFGAW